MLYREIIAVYCQIHTKHKTSSCQQNVQTLDATLDPTQVPSSYCPPLDINIDLQQYLAQSVRAFNRLCPRVDVHKKL
jgi:hypothetical protein